MRDLNRSLPSIDASRFSMVPRADIPRSTFVTTHNLKTTFNATYLVPIYVDEVLPGDVHQGRVHIFARLSTPVFPVMDYMQLETFFFFIPNRLVWENWKKMMGERANPADSISYTIPQVDAQNQAPCTLYDYMGVPGVGQLDEGQDLMVNVLPFRAYNLVWNEWFRDQNLQDQIATNINNGPDASGNYVLMRRNKKHDYFTSALPWPIKGGVEVTVPLAGQAPVTGIAVHTSVDPQDGVPANMQQTDGSDATGWLGAYLGHTDNWRIRAAGTAAGSAPAVYADLSSATGQTINALRLAFQTQRLLERDARSGTRYTELLRAHFGVSPEDTRLQRPEYIGGGRTGLNTQAIPQTSATGLTGGTSPLGALGAAATANDEHRFSYHATEHGFILGLVHVTGEITYQQGLHRMYTRQTRYDYYWPAFAHLGEQAIRNDEIYVTGTASHDTATFGYQERWAEYRHRPSRITGLFRSTAAGNIDDWHLAQDFATAPSLNTVFIQDRAPFDRVLSAGSNANNMQILFDSVFTVKSTRAMPTYSVPGMIDRF